LTPTEYLEQSLTSERGVSEAVMARNRVRLMLVRQSSSKQSHRAGRVELAWRGTHYADYLLQEPRLLRTAAPRYGRAGAVATYKPRGGHLPPPRLRGASQCAAAAGTQHGGGALWGCPGTTTVRAAGLTRPTLPQARPKRLMGQQLTGPMVLQMLRSYVVALNTGSTPTVADAW
jgi:hypothetical protein